MARLSFFTLLLAVALSFKAVPSTHALQGMDLAPPMVKRAEHINLNQRMVRKKRAADDVPIDPIADPTQSTSNPAVVPTTSSTPLPTTQVPPTTQASSTGSPVSICLSPSARPAPGFHTEVLTPIVRQARTPLPQAPVPQPRAPVQPRAPLPAPQAPRRPRPSPRPLHQPFQPPREAQVQGLSLLSSSLRQLLPPKLPMLLLRTRTNLSCRNRPSLVSSSLLLASLLVLPSGLSSANGSLAHPATLKIVSSPSVGNPPSLPDYPTTRPSPPSSVHLHETAEDAALLVPTANTGQEI